MVEGRAAWGSKPPRTCDKNTTTSQGPISHIGGIQPPSNVLEEEKRKPAVPPRKGAIRTLEWFEKFLIEITEGSAEAELDSLYERWDEVASYQWQEAADWTAWPTQPFRRFQLTDIPDDKEVPALAMLPKSTLS